MVKIKKAFATALTLMCFAVNVPAQQIKEVTLTVSGDGATKKEATEVALRSAIEQAFGTFVSANTTILDDALVKDEIATVSSGNIKKYEEVASAQLPNGKTTVTLSAIVSVSKLVSYAQSKGSSAEFAGATFGMNMKLKELNKANEEKAIANMITQLAALVPTMFDFELELDEPTVNKDGNYEMAARVKVIYNDNTELANSILLNTLKSLSLTEKEVEEYEKIGLSTIFISLGNYLGPSSSPNSLNVTKGKFIQPMGQTSDGYSTTYLGYQERYTNIENEGGGVCRGCESPNKYYLRTSTLKGLKSIFLHAVSNFKITDNSGNTSTIEYHGKTTTYTGLLTGVATPNYYSDYGKKTVQGIIIPHIFKDKLFKQKNEYVCYVWWLTLTIPKEDISKYSKFEVSHKI